MRSIEIRVFPMVSLEHFMKPRERLLGLLAHMDQFTMGLHEERKVLRYLIEHAIDARRAGN